MRGRRIYVICTVDWACTVIICGLLVGGRSCVVCMCGMLARIVWILIVRTLSLPHIRIIIDLIIVVPLCLWLLRGPCLRMLQWYFFRARSIIGSRVIDLSSNHI